VDFEDGWLIKSSFITKDEHEACQLTRTKVQQKKKKKKYFITLILSLQYCFFIFSNLGSTSPWPVIGDEIDRLGLEQLDAQKKIRLKV
jgi:hypothetical protein